MNFPGGWSFSRDEGGVVHVMKTKSEANGEIIAVIGLTPDQWDALVAELTLLHDPDFAEVEDRRAVALRSDQGGTEVVPRPAAEMTVVQLPADSEQASEGMLISAPSNEAPKRDKPLKSRRIKRRKLKRRSPPTPPAPTE